MEFEKNTNTILLILKGKIQIKRKVYKDKSVIIFDQNGTTLNFKTSENFKALLLNGEPINEPIVSYGPFVMNTKKEIDQAILDYRNGKMGNLV